ncbi:MAG: GNAT family N-acetyltransferase [Bacteroidota bacterium]
MEIHRIEEHAISAENHQGIEQLFVHCFADYPPHQSFFKQLPSFRYLAFEGDELIGHLAVDHRMMNISGQVSPIFGIVDFCVHPDFQSRRIGSHLLEQLEVLARKSRIDFIVLMAKERGIYEQHDFQLVDGYCRWLIIQNFQTLGVGQRRLDDCLMYKALGEATWGEGPIDFLGWIF